MGISTCTLTGYVGTNHGMRFTKNGTAVMSFSLAVSSRRKQQDGTYSDETNWFDCVMFGNRAEALEPFLQRGCKATIAGRLRQSSYEKDGQTRSKVEIIVDEVELMNARREKQQPEGSPKPETVQAGSMYDDDIPF